MTLNRTYLGYVLLVLSVIVFVIPGEKLYGQGCIVARSSSISGGPETEGGYLAPGEFDFSIGLRHQFSFRHFVGDVPCASVFPAASQVADPLVEEYTPKRFPFAPEALG